MTVEQLLLDTGALVALLDRSQPQHRPFVGFFESWRGVVVSTEAILTEATYLLGRTLGGRERCLDFFLSGGAILVPSNLSSLRRCRELIAKYSDQPMDLADATLVALAEELETPLVFTTDRRDFTAYRYNDRERFKILPEM